MSTESKGAVVVTGAGSGIGNAVARRLLEEGYAVAGWDLAEGALAGFNNPRVSFTSLDVRDKPRLLAAAEEATRRFGAIDGLVCCAGIFKAVPFLQLDDATWDAHFSINLKGSLFACQAVLPAMRRQQRGNIVLFASDLARSGAPGCAHYAASKGGILGLARSLALETAKDGIRVNVVSPGITDTPMPHANFPAEVVYARGRDVPLGRIGQPQDMAEAALFLLGDDSSYITGQDIRVNGGARLF